MKWILCFLFSLISSTSLATEMVGAISAGTGGTGRASVESIESLYLNPASLGHINKFHFGTIFQTGFLREGVSRNTYGLNLSDGTDEVLVPGSIGYRRHTIKVGLRDFKEQEVKIGGGYRLTKRFSVGLALTYLDGETPSGVQHRQYNGDLGVLIGIAPNWALSVTGENLVENTDKDLPEPLRRLSRAALGTQIIFQNIMLGRYEVLSPLYEEGNTKLTHRVGLGMIFQSNFIFNMGYSVDDYAQQNWGSLGLVWQGPRLKLAYSIQNESRQELGNRHLIDLWLDI